MHQFRNLKPLDTMERITRKTLCEDFDNILDRVDKEDTGFVILDDESKDRYVLCPAHWMDFQSPSMTTQMSFKSSFRQVIIYLFV